MKRFHMNLLAIFFAFLLAMPNPVWSQVPPGGDLAGQTGAPVSGTRKQLATIIFAGLAGAILGLSTLSFHGRPQEHLSNIAMGFALGIIGGTVYTTYRAAKAPYEIYDYGFEELMTPSGSDAVGLARNSKVFSETPRLSYTWEF